MKTNNKKHNAVIALVTAVLLVLSWGAFQYRQMSNLTFQIFYPEDTFPSRQFQNVLKDSLFNRSATEFSEFLSRLQFLPGDDEFYEMDLDYNNHIDITVDDNSEYLVNDYFVFEKPNQYIIVDVQETYPDRYAVVEGDQYDYLHQKLLEGREKLGITSATSQK